MHLRKSIWAGFVAAVLVALPVTAANASTGIPDPTTDSVTTSSPMVVSGYDAQVAEANGYKIITHADGSQESVPVTAAAVAQLKQANQLRLADQQKAAGPSAVGNCGSSWATGSKIANNTVAFNTGFVVYLAAHSHNWRVYATGFVTGNYWSTSGMGPASGNANWNGAMGGVIGPGVGGVPLASAAASVVLVDGSVCFSYGPTFTFG